MGCDMMRHTMRVDKAVLSTNALTHTFSGQGSDILDICSSWISHFPEDFPKTMGKRVGLGMNEFELKENKQIDEYTVRNLNKEPTLPYPDASFDVVTCVVSIDYLNKPLEIFKEVARVLRPGALLSIS